MKSRDIAVLTSVTLGIIFLIDILAPAGWAGYLLYIAPFFYFPIKRRHLAFFLGMASVLSLGGHFLTHPVREPGIDLLNRSFAIFIMWTLGFIVENRRHSKERLKASLGELERRVEARTAELNALFNAMAEPVVEFDREGEPVRTNAAAEAMFGKVPAGDSGHVVKDSIKLLTPEGSPVPPGQFPSARALKGEFVTGEEFSIIRNPSGRTMTYQVSAAPLYSVGRISGAVVVWHDITARKRGEQEILSLNKYLSAAVREKDTLLRELHHRTKNNMQVVSSLISLQTAALRDEKLVGSLIGMKSRIQAMALVHERLYKSGDLSMLDMKEYVTELARSLLAVYCLGCDVRLNMDIENVQLDLDTAIPFGLVINELMSNSLKYAFTPAAGGEIRISVKNDSGGRICLHYLDSGPGLPAGFDFKNPGTLGLKLVRNLVLKQLKGDIELAKERAEFLISFGQREPAPAITGHASAGRA